ncbi:MarR family winged helix-turn-helix transcriptional regulator [Micromonospora cathayae]|uniref:MarR family transcriptional regulator n=1 Tax=Micromonospora cathayae TaxID=3028804 RepID=A0ABY7ZSD7_9ACTN|nr:MarR family transcriptional regulator [Micromonospora sp. HUAS 3]WDZ84968.1 MarR family transcriptional regulator [Micromonospora sp. HUAS 3]
MAAALDDAAAALLSVWEEARERTTNRLSAAQLRAVMAVEEHDGINLRRLSGLLGMLLSSASRLCDRLVAAGMLEREPGRFDRREISLHLTPEAARLLAELRADRRARLAEILAGMSPAGREALLRGVGEFDEVARRLPPPTLEPDEPAGPPGREPSPRWYAEPDATGSARRREPLPEPRRAGEPRPVEAPGPEAGRGRAALTAVPPAVPGPPPPIARPA